MIILIILILSFFKAGPEVGVVASVSKDSAVRAAGMRYIEENVVNSFSPRKVNEAQFKENLARFKAAKVKLGAVNVFFPGDIKLVGDQLNESIVLGYVDTVMRRCKQAGVKIIVLGSGGSRRLPPGYDSLKASRQFIDIVRKMAGVAAKYNRIIAIENLNHTETNFVLSLSQAIQYVKAVDHPNFKLTADIYHMLMENEPAEVIDQARGLLVHMHIAEKEERAYPGKKGVNFVPYFKAMNRIGYKGLIMMEARFNDFDKEAALGKAYLDEQLALAK
jgi:sugar phosphate isomerase/epimerase